ncbi:hypothetical protein ACMFMF_005673 [Clarireedia jacksonii]
MPWLSLPNGTPNGGPVHAPPPAATQIPSSTPATITVIPSIIDPTCGTSPAQYRHSTIENFQNSLHILAHNMHCIPRMMSALVTMSMIHSIFRSSLRELRELATHAILCIIECWALIVIIPAFLTMPGAVFTGACLAVWGAVLALSWGLWGNERICEGITPAGAEDFADERWIFVNGSCTSHTQMHHHLNRLSTIFQRRMTGTHNRTLGLPLDIILHLLSLNLPIHRILYAQLREALLSPSTRKLILLSHSTGSKIVSDVLDQLHADLPQGFMAKLEIYTFGAAGGSFSNPLLNASTLDMTAIAEDKPASCERVISHIEHYLPLATSPLSTISILHPILHTLDSRFCGRIFILNGYAPLFFSQYLDLMFTYQIIPVPAQQASKIELEERSFWDERIDVDGETAEKREFTAGARGVVGSGLGERRWSGLLREEREREKNGSVNGRRSWNWSKMGVMDGVGLVRRESKGLEGRMMREVGRLGGYEGVGGWGWI